MIRDIVVNDARNEIIIIEASDTYAYKVVSLLDLSSYEEVSLSFEPQTLIIVDNNAVCNKLLYMIGGLKG